MTGRRFCSLARGFCCFLRFFVSRERVRLRRLGAIGESSEVRYRFGVRVRAARGLPATERFALRNDPPPLPITLRGSTHVRLHLGAMVAEHDVMNRRLFPVKHDGLNAHVATVSTNLLTGSTYSARAHFVKPLHHTTGPRPQRAAAFVYATPTKVVAHVYFPPATGREPCRIPAASLKELFAKMVVEGVECTNYLRHPNTSPMWARQAFWRNVPGNTRLLGWSPVKLQGNEKSEVAA